MHSRKASCKWFLHAYLLLITISQVTAQVRMPGTGMNIVKDQYQPIDGFLWLKSGERLEGALSFATKVTEEQRETGNKSANGAPIYKTVKLYSITEFRMNDVVYPPGQVMIYGDNQERIAADFVFRDKKGRPDPSKKEEENFNPGHIIDADGKKHNGYVAVRENGSYLLFSEEPNGKVRVCLNLDEEAYRLFNVRYAVQQIDGEYIDWMRFDRGFRNMEKFKWSRGFIDRGDGEKIYGKVSLQSKSYGYGMNAWSTAVFWDEADESIPELLGLNSDQSVEIVGVTGDDDQEYLYFDNAFYPKEKLRRNILKNDNKDPEKNFHDGFIQFYDGKQLRGQIARAATKSKGFYYLGEQGEIRAFYGNRKVWYFSQTIDGMEKRFIRIREKYAEWLYFKYPISYFRNPYPTHVRKGLSNFVGGLTQGLTETITDELIEQSANKAAQKSFKKNQDLGEVVEIAKSAQKLDEGFTFTYSSDEMGIYFEEYILLFNGQSPLVVYKKNINDLLVRLTKHCDNFMSMTKSDFRELDDIGKFDDTVMYLNEHKCY